MRSKNSRVVACLIILAGVVIVFQRSRRRESTFVDLGYVRGFSDGLAPIQVDGRYGFIDRQGKEAMAPTYQWAGEMSEGRAAIIVDREVGYIDRNGTVVIAPTFDIPSDIPNETIGKAAAPISGYFSGHVCYFTSSGGIFTWPRLSLAYRFSEGMACVRVGDKYGYVDKAGRMSIAPRFVSACNFSEGLAAVEVDGAAFGARGRKWGYINQAGELVIAPRFDLAFEFHETRARIMVNHKVGYIDGTGNTVVAPRYTYGSADFSDGLAAVCVGEFGENSGYIDAAGTLVIPARFEQAGSFREGLAPVQIGAMWGYIDKSGVIVIQPQYSQASEFSEGLAGVKVSLGKYGFIDRTGRLVISPIFDEVYDFSEGRALVEVDGLSGQFGYVDTNGDYIWPAPE